MAPAAKSAKGSTMRLKLRIIGFALIAICAMGAISAMGAQAKTWDSGVQTTYYTGTQNGTMTFTTTAGTIKCKLANFKGEATATGGSGSVWTRQTIELTPTFADCIGFGQAATITAAGCEFTFNANGTLDSITGCTAGALVVHVVAGNCTVTITSQHPTEALMSYSNEGAEKERTVSPTFDITSKLTYVVHGPGTICGTAGHYTDGSATGSMKLKGYSDASHTVQVGIWIT
jgi:hypothetical protein